MFSYRCYSRTLSEIDFRHCCAVRVMHNTTNYKPEQLIYICQSVHSFPIGCGDVLVVWRCYGSQCRVSNSQCRAVVSNSRQ